MLPEEGATHREIRNHEKWNKANEMAKCYIMASISNVLQAKHQDMVTAKEIMDRLEGIFAKGTRQARQAAVVPS